MLRCHGGFISSSRQATDGAYPRTNNRLSIVWTIRTHWPSRLFGGNVSKCWLHDCNMNPETKKLTNYATEQLSLGAILYCTVLDYTLLYSTLHYTILYSTLLYTTLHYTILYSTVLYCTILY